MKNLILFSLLSLFVCISASQGFAQSLEGRWESKSFEPSDANWIRRVMIFNGSHIIYTRYSYDSPNSKDPYLEVVVEGEWKSEKNIINPNVLNINVVADKNIFTIKKLSRNLGRLFKAKCIKKDIPMDIITTDCAFFNSYKGKRNRFYTGMLLTDGTLLAGTGNRYGPNTEVDRPISVSIFALIKKP